MMSRGVEFFAGLDVARRGLVWLTGLADFRKADGSIEPFYVPLHEVMPSTAWGACLLLTGLALAAAVVINGFWKPTPFIRMGCIVLSMIPTAVITITFAKYGNSGPATIAWTGELLTLLSLAAALLFCAYDTARVRNGYACD